MEVGLMKEMVDVASDGDSQRENFGIPLTVETVK
jgi:hypothetical protein